MILDYTTTMSLCWKISSHVAFTETFLACDAKMFSLLSLLTDSLDGVLFHILSFEMRLFLAYLFPLVSYYS